MNTSAKKIHKILNDFAKNAPWRKNIPWYKRLDKWFDSKSAAMPKMPPWFWIVAVITLEVFLSF